MKTSILVTLALATLTATVVVASTAPAPEAAVTSKSLDFLKGSWKAQKWGGEFHAYYSTGDGGKVLSHSTLIREEKVAFFEFEVFEVRDGKLTVTPFPGGQPAARFTATEVKKNQVVFDNPDKDFPTRITYAMVSPDKLRITLADPHRNSDKKDIFELDRVKKKAKK